MLFVMSSTHWVGVPLGSAMSDVRTPAADDCVTTHESTDGAHPRLSLTMRGISAMGFGDRLNAARTALSDDSAVDKSRGTPRVQKFISGTLSRNSPVESTETRSPSAVTYTSTANCCLPSQ